ncbi:unnamed protein product [Schistosoma mattheei]|uniref:Uncharacterized protein n=1 Tax=Schistosoma mattheei TaxID=31246 RepID=A0A183NLM2_9TREM|nr:unnamed protein product [Schistosoma mattheei]
MHGTYTTQCIFSLSTIFNIPSKEDGRKEILPPGVSDTTQHAPIKSQLTEKIWKMLKHLHIWAASLMNTVDVMQM